MGFADYTKIMLAPTLVAGTVTVVLLYLVFRPRLTGHRLVLLTDMSPEDALRDRRGAVLGGGLLLTCLLLLSVAPMLDMPLWAITLVFAVVFGARNLWVYPFSTSHLAQRSSCGTAATAGSDTTALSSELAGVQVDTATIVPSVAGSERVGDGGTDGSVSNSSAPTRSVCTTPTGRAASPLTFMDAVAAMPWNLVPFVLGMFILVESLTASGVIAVLADAAATSVGTSPLRGVLVSGCTWQLKAYPPYPPPPLVLLSVVLCGCACAWS